MDLFIKSVFLSAMLMSSFFVHAGVTEDVQSGEPLWKIVSNAKKAGVAPDETVSQMIQSGVAPLNAVSATVRAFPADAAKITAAAVMLKPNMAKGIEQSALRGAPGQKANIRLAVKEALTAPVNEVESAEVLEVAIEPSAEPNIENTPEASVNPQEEIIPTPEVVDQGEPAEGSTEELAEEVVEEVVEEVGDVSKQKRKKSKRRALNRRGGRR